MPGGVGGDRSGILTAPIPIVVCQSSIRGNDELAFAAGQEWFCAGVFSINLLNRLKVC